MSAMIPGKMYSCYSMGDAVTVAKSSAHSWIGVLAAQLTTSGMTKQEDGTYTYPETGALRAHCYYNKDAVLTAIRGGAESVVPTVGAGSGTVNYDTAFTAEGLAAADMTGADFADTMNDSMAASAKLLKAYGLNAALNSWEDVGGRVLPTGTAWTAGDTSDLQTSRGNAS